jgi:preprotein translocase subunit SecA
MTRADLPIPGPVWGDYPQRHALPPGLAVRWSRAVLATGGGLVDALDAWLPLRDARWLARVNAEAESMAQQEPGIALHLVRSALLRQGLTPATSAQALALAGCAAHATLGVRPFGTQLIAARAMLDQQLAEMATGEGKTLAVALAAAAGALAGMPVHVLTANDYLVSHDAQKMRPLYAALGLNVGQVLQADDAAARRRAYACDVTYVTARELVFDYLRDGVSDQPGGAATTATASGFASTINGSAATQPHTRPHTLLRGLCMAIVDEADAILVDEASMPLVLSQPDADPLARQHAQQVLRFARTLGEEADYQLDDAAMAATLTPRGRERLDHAAATVAAACDMPAWRHRVHREHSVCTALAALHLYQRDRHYLVRDGRVHGIDQNTGRVAEGRVWGQGLQQLIEVKEGCEPSPAMATVAQITYQRFFTRYVRLSGCSGTLREAAVELRAAYGLAVRRVPLRCRSRRRWGATRLYPDHAALWSAVADHVAQMRARDRPVLLATESVAEAQDLARVLMKRGFPAAVLHARNDEEEARVIAQAGQRGAITVTTSISGRGTDILLGIGVAALGGLHVISCQLNVARRIDRQLAGRAARQGDPGSVETMLSLDSALLARAWSGPVRAALRPLAWLLPGPLLRVLLRWPQRSEERSHREARRRLLEQDERSAGQLPYGGPAA